MAFEKYDKPIGNGKHPSWSRRDSVKISQDGQKISFSTSARSKVPWDKANLYWDEERKLFAVGQGEDYDIRNYSNRSCVIYATSFIRENNIPHNSRYIPTVEGDLVVMYPKENNEL